MSFGETPDYSGFDCETWPKRSNTEHRSLAKDYLRKTNRAQQKKFESEHGFRFSQLLELPYFDIVRCCSVDPMHNLFLGTAKYFTGQLLDKGILLKENLQLVEQRVSAITAPIDIGRLPSKIASGFAGFKADQWKNWTTVFSIVALKGLIPESYLACWSKFVNACRLLCLRSVNHSTLAIADDLLRSFCIAFQELFGNYACTINMHKHLHLKECVEDFGPVYSFWCYPFERFNGQLGAYHTNNRNVERQIVQKFLREQSLALADINTDLETGMVTITRDTLKHIQRLQKCPLPTKPYEYEICTQNVSSAIKSKTNRRLKDILSIERQVALKQTYSCLYGEILFDEFALEVECLRNLSFCGMELNPLSIIAVMWPPQNPECRICQIQNIFVHSMILTPNSSTSQFQFQSEKTPFAEHVIAEVQFFSKHPHENYFGEEHIVVTWPEVDSTMVTWSMLPIQRIVGMCATGDILLPIIGDQDLEVNQLLKVSTILPINVAVN